MPEPLCLQLLALFFICIVPVAQVTKKSRCRLSLIRGSIVTLGMQGKKDYQEKLFANFQLSERIPEE